MRLTVDRPSSTTRAQERSDDSRSHESSGVGLLQATPPDSSGQYLRIEHRGVEAESSERKLRRAFGTELWSAPAPGASRLAMGAADDPLEHEADRVADAVLAGGLAVPQSSGTSPHMQRKCAECEEEERLQRKATSEAKAGAAPEHVTNRIEARRGSGTALDTTTRSYFEPRFGADFAQVRVHADPEASTLARAVQADAFTVGADIYFGPGKLDPGSHTGRRLLAHELTHVVQQSSALSRSTARIQRQPSGSGSPCGSEFKREFRGQINGERPEAHNGVPRMYYATLPEGTNKPGQTVEALVKGTELDAGQRGGYAKLWRAVCFKTSKMPTQILWVLDAYVTNLDAQPKKEEEKSETAAEPVEPAPAPPPEPEELRAVLAAIRAWPSRAPADLAKELIELLKSTGVDLSDPDILQHITRAVAPRGPEALAELMGRIEEELLSQSQAMPPGGGALEQLAPTHPYLGKGGVGLFPYTGAALSPIVTVGVKVVESAAAFIQGIIEGLIEKLDRGDIEALAKKLAQSTMLNIVAPTVFAAGAVVGIVKDLVGTIDFIVNFSEVVSSIGSFLEDLLTSTELAREMGRAIGAEYAEQIKKMSEKNVFAFTYDLGVLLGPTIVYTLLSLAGIPEAVAAKILPRIKAVLAKAKGLGKMRKLFSSRHRPKVHAPDVPSGKHAPHKVPELEGEAPHKAPKVEGEVPDVKVPHALAGSCTIGSLLCSTIPKALLKEVDPYPHPDRVAMPKGPFRLRGAPDPVYSELRKVTGEQLQKIYLRNPDTWTAQFRAAWKKLNPGVKESNAIGSKWPQTSDGRAWQVHHRKPLDYGGDNAPGNLVALELDVHVKFTGWWAKLKYKFRAHFSAAEWKKIKGGDIDVTFP